MADQFQYTPTTLNSPSDTAFAITANDATDLAYSTRGLYVGVKGDVKVDLAKSGTITFKNLAAGVFHPIRAKKVYATGTTATDIIGVY